MNEKNIFNLKTMLNLKYIERILPDMTQCLQKATAKNPYSFAELHELKNKSEWQSWKEENQILDNKPENIEDYVKVTGVGGNNDLFVPKDFAEKALVLGYLP